MIDYEVEQVLLDELAYDYITKRQVDMSLFNKQSTVGVVANISKQSAERVMKERLRQEYSNYMTSMEMDISSEEKITELQMRVLRLFRIIWFYAMTEEEWDEAWLEDVVKLGGGYDED